MNYRIVTALTLLIPAVVIGNSLLDESQRYVLLLEDEFSNEVYLEFYEVESVKNRQVIVDDGFVLLGDKEFDIIEEWKGSFLDDDKLFFMTGSVENSDEKIDVFVMGKFLRKTIDGSMYKITIHIHSDQTIELQTEGEIIGIIPKEIKEELESAEPIELLFLIKDSHHRYQEQEYIFTTKLYDKKQNPLGSWDTKGGEISDGEIVVQIMDLNGNMLREIKGITNEYGLFDGKFVLGKGTFPRGEYLVSYTAKYQNNMKEYTKPLYVFEIDKNADYRNFTPTSDIDRGQWSDQEGNKDHLMYNELDEFTRNDSDYVSSKALGNKNNITSDTFHVRITTYAGVTTDHNHVISYTIRKELAGGYPINFIVTLFEGTKQIAQWTHLDVDENFNLIINVLTRDQVNLISNYNNLSLSFTAESLPCDSCQKREAQVSWIHMLV